jgi:adenylate cyclase
VVSMLNEYFEAMVEVVFEHNGVLDKFLGDGLMAVWGTPVRSPDDAAQAVRAAKTMREVLDSVVNAARARRGEAPLRAGYGIATGMVIAGGMGAKRRQDFTVIGDTVYLSRRLCGVARPGQVLVCEATERAASQSGLRFVPLEARTVKGVSRPVPVFELPRS